MGTAKLAVEFSPPISAEATQMENLGHFPLSND